MGGTRTPVRRAGLRERHAGIPAEGRGATGSAVPEVDAARADALGRGPEPGAWHVTGVEPQGQADRRARPHDQTRTIRSVFADATTGYAAVDQLRASGFRIDLAASIAGDLIVSIQAEPARADEVAALVAAHDGRIETPSGD